MIVGIGIDIIQTARIHQLVEKYGDRFTGRWFAPSEISYCMNRDKPFIQFSMLMAAKEATFKALGGSAILPLCWKDIVIVFGTTGFPALVLEGAPRDCFKELGMPLLHISLSHCSGHAVALVIAEKIVSPGF